MFTTQLDTATRTLYIEFPEGMRTRKESFPVTSSQQAINLFNINVAKYIIATLTRWVNHREWTLRYTGELTSVREYAVATLKCMLHHHAESKLHTIVLYVCKHENDFLKLAPGEKSRYYQKYLHTIVPIRYWCRNEYNRLYHPDLKDRI